jgi:adhesin transport system membrane fusion protein
MSALEELLEARSVPRWRSSETTRLAALGAFVVWAALAPVEEVATAPGEVVPRGNVRVIQHLEGGIIKQIYVTEGDSVGVGDSLVEVSLAITGVNYGELEVRRDGLRLNRARLKAESQGAAPDFPQAEASRRANLVRSEQMAFDARQRELESNLTMAREQALQRQEEVNELGTTISALGSDLELNREKLAISTDLLESELTSRIEHIQLKREIGKTKGDLAGSRHALKGAKARLAEALEKEHEGSLKFRREAQEELGRVELELARTQKLLAEASDQARRRTITSPIDGVVKNLRHHTIGGVIKPGEALMEIVPLNETLVIEAKLSPVDRGYVEEEQRARVKVSSYDFIRYGTLGGRVIHIAADSNNEQGSDPYFRVVVETDSAFLGSEASPLPISAGMQATVDIRTGSKSVMSYLLKPVLKLRHEAFRER